MREAKFQRNTVSTWMRGQNSTTVSTRSLPQQDGQQHNSMSVTIHKLCVTLDAPCMRHTQAERGRERERDKDRRDRDRKTMHSNDIVGKGGGNGGLALFQRTSKPHVKEGEGS